MELKEVYKIFLSSTGVCTDTRKLKKGNLYIALKGENFNGNLFAQKAMDDGAIAALVDEKLYENAEKHIYGVKDGLSFLQDLAQYHRRQLSIPIISLTGSNGKTTTKELIANSLKQKYKVAFTQGNLNNHIGVPLTLLSITANHEIAVVEMGANHQKEIEQLCHIAEPDYGYITNFGKAHLEGFGSMEGVIQGKSEMYRYLRNQHKTVFVNQDDSLQTQLTKGIQQITFGFKENASYPFKRNTQHGYAGVIFNQVAINSHLTGSYNENNIAAAITIAFHFGVELNLIQKAIADYIPSINRSQEIEKSGYHIILDAYNANPSSMEAALENFSQKPTPKAVILGDMFELGMAAAEEHQTIAHLAKSFHIDEIYLVGENFAKIKADAAVHQFESRASLIEYLKQHPIKAKHILIKGSRGMALEKILDFI